MGKQFASFQTRSPCHNSREQQEENQRKREAFLEKSKKKKMPMPMPMPMPTACPVQVSIADIGDDDEWDKEGFEPSLQLKPEAHTLVKVLAKATPTTTATPTPPPEIVDAVVDEVEDDWENITIEKSEPVVASSTVSEQAPEPAPEPETAPETAPEPTPVSVPVSVPVLTQVACHQVCVVVQNPPWFVFTPKASMCVIVQPVTPVEPLTLDIRNTPWHVFKSKQSERSRPSEEPQCVLKVKSSSQPDNQPVSKRVRFNPRVVGIVITKGEKDIHPEWATHGYSGGEFSQPTRQFSCEICT